jgi:cytochrome P450
LAGAGTETTGSILDRITYHILSNSSIRENLLAELKDFVERHSTGADSLLDYNSLQDLVYLTATINEALRLSNSVSGRLPRISRRRPLTYEGNFLPPGTVISVNSSDPLTNPAVFPQPMNFDPNRWVTASAEQKKQMEKYFVPFGRGARSCIGRELAMMTLYLTTANFVWRHGKEARLWETGPEDVKMEHDFFAPFARRESQGVRVLLKEKG